MDPQIAIIIQTAKNANGDDEIKHAHAELSKLIKENPTEILLLETRAELNTKLQDFGSAINDYRTIYALAPAYKKALIQIEQLTTILKYQNTDIFENPNTTFDPWLDD